ncbi:MAG: flagellar motor protein MotB [Candidatus Margulisbacteria bacterium]|nr:flagellar motor protein MotB [Candidatus Margulisiibacteriota bacterium]
MIERRRNKSSKEVLFLTSFSDMVSLLMAFFILMFSMSTLDTVKFQQLSVSFSNIFNSKMKEAMLQKYEEEERILKKIYTELQYYIEKEKLQNDVSVKIEEHSIVMDLGSKLLFPVAEAKLKEEAKLILAEFVQYFRQVKNANIVVEGHTDDIPIKTLNFESNWELSAARAASVVRFLAENGIKEENCYIIGYNQYRPLVANTSEETRAKNRRVRIIFKPVVGDVKDDGKIDFNAIMNTDTGTQILDVTKSVQDSVNSR